MKTVGHWFGLVLNQTKLIAFICCQQQCNHYNSYLNKEYIVTDKDNSTAIKSSRLKVTGLVSVSDLFSERNVFFTF